MPKQKQPLVKKKPPVSHPARFAAPEPAPAAAPRPDPFTRLPLWAWLLLFIVPLVLSELMFYRVGRTFSLIAFPILWLSFWAALLRRAGRPILKRRRE